MYVVAYLTKFDKINKDCKYILRITNIKICSMKKYKNDYDDL